MVARYPKLKLSRKDNMSKDTAMMSKMVTPKAMKVARMKAIMNSKKSKKG